MSNNIGISIDKFYITTDSNLLQSNKIIRGKEYVLREENIWPSLDQEIVISFVIMFFLKRVIPNAEVCIAGKVQNTKIGLIFF